MQLAPIQTVVVGIVVYNTDIQIFKRTLSTLMISDYPITIAVLCNAASAEYQSKITQLCEEFGAICLSNEPNRGFGAGHNSIVRRTESDWYICCNPDVEVQPSTIYKLIDFGQGTPNAVIIGPRICYPNGAPQPLARRHLTLFTWIHRQLWRIAPKLFKPHEIRFDYQKTQPAQFVSGCFFLISRSKFIALDGFDENFFLYAEDADISIRASKIGLNYYVAETEIIHIWTTNIKKSKKAIILELKSLARFALKHSFLALMIKRLGCYSPTRILAKTQ